MNNIQKRFIYYLLGCIGTRMVLTILAKNLSKEKVQYMSFITLVMGLGFLYIYAFGNERADNQLEWASAKIWWNDYRIIHGILYTSFSILGILKINKAWILLGLDTFLGLVLFLHYHYISGNYESLF